MADRGKHSRMRFKTLIYLRLDFVFLLTVHLDIIVKKTTKLMHNLFLVHGC